MILALVLALNIIPSPLPQEIPLPTPLYKRLQTYLLDRKFMNWMQDNRFSDWCEAKDPSCNPGNNFLATERGNKPNTSRV